jgi:hypothetical protein
MSSLSPYGRLEYETLLQKLGSIPSFGKQASVWQANVNAVTDMIGKLELKAATAEDLHCSAKPDIAEKISSEQAYAEWWFKQGGIRVPHLHNKGEIYLLNKDQWNTFVSAVITDLKKRLGDAKTVNFGHLMELSEAINEII